MRRSHGRPFERLPLQPPIAAMETRQVDRIPEGADWSYEPKWDGFRCIAFRDGEHVELESKAGQSLTRYFPEIVDALRSAESTAFIVDGELFIEAGAGFDFDALLQRVHPAASRVRALSERTPAMYAVFDLLAQAGERVYLAPLHLRRRQLERFISHNFENGSRVVLSPATADLGVARAWLGGAVARMDGVIAKRDVPYAFGSRDAVVKIKRRYTADCVIGGFRAGKDGSIASLLLGLYEGDLLHHVGFIGSMTAAQRAAAAERLKPLVESPGFTGVAPGGVSRWRKEETTWSPVRPVIVVEVSFDHVTGRRFRHAARLLRWRPDKAPTQCTMEQLLDPKG